MIGVRDGALLAALIVAPLAQAQRFGGRDVPVWSHGPRTVDVVHLALDVRVDLEARAVSGTSVLTVVPLAEADTVRIDAVDMKIEAVRTGPAGDPERRATVEWEYDGRRLDVPLGDGPTDVEVRYHAVPKTGLHFVSADPAYPGIGPEAWTQGEPEESRFWHPTHDYPDDRFTTELVAQVPRQLSVISNGSLLSDTTDGELRRVHYTMRERHPSYLVSLVVAPLERFPLAHARVPLAVWAAAGSGGDVEANFGATARMLDFLEGYTGLPYPYPRYDQVLATDFMWSGMENITASTLTRDALLGPLRRGEESSEGLVLHELAHQWFGNLVTCRGWRHLWLNEGFASYFETLWLEHTKGRAEADLDRLGGAEWYFSASGDRGLDEARFEHPDDLFDAHSYAKGAAVLHMLRLEVGDDAFRRGVQRYLAAHQDGLVESADLRRAVETTSGRDLTRFFEEWVETPGHPSVAVEWRWDAAKSEVVLKLDPGGSGRSNSWQLRLPVSIGPDKEVVVEVGSGASTHRLPASEPPRFVAVDPRGDWLVELSEEPSTQELMARLETSREPVTRVRATLALSGRELAPGERDNAADVLARLAGAAGEPDLVRTRAAEALGALGGAAAVTSLRKLAQNASPKVRAAAYGGLAVALARPDVADAPELPNRAAVRTWLKNAFRDERSPGARAAVVAASSELASKAAHMEVCLDALRAPPTEGSHAVALAGLDCLEAEGSPAALEATLKALAWGTPHAVREKAVGRAARLAQGNPKRVDTVRAAIEPLLQDPKRTVVLAAIAAIGSLGDKRSAPALAALEPWVYASRDLELALRRAQEALGVRQKRHRPAKASTDDRLESLEQRIEHLERGR